MSDTCTAPEGTGNVVPGSDVPANEGTENAPPTTPKAGKKRKAEISQCELCKVELTSPVMANLHYAGAKHTKKLKALEAGTGNGTDNVDTPTPKKKKKQPAEITQCEICHVELSSPIMASSHYAGAKHAKKVKALEAANGSGDLNKAKCEICNVELTSPVMASSHYAGAKHTKKLKALEAAEGNVTSSDVEGSQGTDNDKTGTGFYCSFCNITLNSPQQLSQHRTGSKHKKLVQKGHEASGAIGTHGKTSTPASTQQYEFSCSICCMSMVTEAQYLSHMKSIEHKRRLAEIGGMAMPQEMGDIGDFPAQHGYHMATTANH